MTAAGVDHIPPAYTSHEARIAGVNQDTHVIW
jgi:hypothetical protein